MFKYLFYSGLESDSSPEVSPESSLCTQRTPSKSGDSNRSDDDKLKFVGIVRKRLESKLVSIIDEYPVSSCVNRDVIKRTLTTETILPDQYYICKAGAHRIHILCDSRSTMFVCVCSDSYPGSMAFAFVKEVNDMFNCRIGQSFKDYKERPLHNELMKIFDKYASIDISQEETSCDVEAITIALEDPSDLIESLHSVGLDNSSRSVGLRSFSNIMKSKRFKKQMVRGKLRMWLSRMKIRIIISLCALIMLAVAIYVFKRWQKYQHEHH